jgi:hypothetical protein
VFEILLAWDGGWWPGPGLQVLSCARELDRHRHPPLIAFSGFASGSNLSEIEAVPRRRGFEVVRFTALLVRFLCHAAAPHRGLPSLPFSRRRGVGFMVLFSEGFSGIMLGS